VHILDFFSTAFGGLFAITTSHCHFAGAKIAQIYAPPGKFYLIYANRTFACFTSKKNQKNVVYDLSDRELLPVR